MKVWIEPKEYQLKDGRWVPQADLFEDHGYALDISPIVSARNMIFATRDEARSWSIGLGQQWMAQNW